jgi:hypothetical protein
VIHVPGDELTIHAGIAAASAGDSVLVAPGTYLEHEIGLRSGVSLIGVGGPDSVAIDAEGQGTVLLCDGASPGPVSGFTIKGGLASNGSGGGLWCWGDCSLDLQDCVFLENSALDGSAVFAHPVPLENGATLVFDGCDFIGNSEAGADTAASSPGAVDLFNSSATFLDCSFIGNAGAARFNGCHVSIDGCSFQTNDNLVVGIDRYSSPSVAVISDCVFEGNTGLGLSCSDSTLASVSGCTFAGNQAGLSVVSSTVTVEGCRFLQNTHPAYGFGLSVGHGSCEVLYSELSGNEGFWGGVLCDGADLALEGCVLVSNSAHRGGAIACYDSSPQIANCTLVSNRADQGGGVYCYNSSPSIVRSVLAFSGSGSALYCVGTSAPEVDHCSIFSNVGGDDLCGSQGSNSLVDPLLCDLEVGDVSLCGNSVCLPDNNPWGEQIGAVGAGCDACDSGVAEVSWGRLKSLFR